MKEMQDQTSTPFSVIIAHLLSDPAFLKLHYLCEQPNFFRIVGRTYTETWHSAFLGWLLDPRGSHGLGDFPLIRLLVTLADRAVQPHDLPPAFLSPEELAREAVLRNLQDVVVLPNERNPHEKTLDKDKRVDVWIEDESLPSDDRPPLACKRLIVIVEMKIKANFSPDQAQKYPDYIVYQHGRSSNTRGVCVFLAPGASRADSQTALQIANDDRWYCLDYQDLYDGILHPCLDRGELRKDGALFIEQYIRNLRSSTKYGRLAMTKRERELAREVVEKYRGTLLTLANVLSEEEDEPALENVLFSDDEKAAYGKGQMTLEITGSQGISGSTVPELVRAVLERLSNDKKLDNLEMPYGISQKTCLLNTIAMHPDGKQFRGNSVKFKSDTRTIFGNIWYSRKRAQQLLAGLLRDAGYQLAGEKTSF